MDNRSDAFRQEILRRSEYLGSSSIQDLVSIKYRDGGNSFKRHEENIACDSGNRAAH